MPNFDSNSQNASRQYVPVATVSSIARRINLQKRYILAILTSIGLALAFTIRSNECTYRLDPAHFAPSRGWGEIYFMMGYFLIQIPAALILNRFSPFKIFGLLILSTTVLGLGTPIFVKLFHHTWLMYIGFVHGILQGALFPAAQGMWQYWLPQIERSTLISIAYSGCFFGISLGAKFSSLVCDLLPSDNVLIVYGILGIVWFFSWTWSVYERPSAHPTISDAELQYLNQSIQNQNSTNNSPNDSPNSIPWKQVLGSKSVWALYVVLFCRAWTSMYLLQGDIAGYDFIHEYNVWFVSYPAGVVAICLPIVGFLADLILTRTSKSVSYIRRLYISGGFLGQLLIYLPGFLMIHHIGPLFVDIFISCFFYSCILCGFFTNNIDVAPKYAHATMAIANMINAVATFVLWSIPIALPFESHEDDSTYKPAGMEEFFVFAIVLHLIGLFTYYICGSGEIEQWAKSDTEGEDNRAVSFSNNSIGV